MRPRTRTATAFVALLLAGSAPWPARARPASRTVRTARFALTLPPGWYVAERKPGPTGQRFVPAHRVGSADARVFHFADGRGNYFSVHVDQATDFEADAIWSVHIAPGGASIEVGREGEMCRGSAGTGSQGPCSAGNGTLEIATIPALRIRGHTYSFQFGNTLRERGVDLEPFRWLLGSFRAR